MILGGEVTKVLVDDIDLSVIAYAIRSLNGTTTLYTPSKMGTTLNEICSYYKSLLDRTATEIMFPSGLTSIGANAFSNCTNLTHVTIPSSIVSIEENAFSGCENLTIINIYRSEGEIHGAPWGATNATINYNYGENPSDIIEINSPFEWYIGQANDTTGALTPDTQAMRIVSTEIIGFTTEATIDMSSYSGMYAYYLFDQDGNFIEKSSEWISTSTVFTLPVDRTVRFKIRHNNYELWTDETISTFTNAVKVYVKKDGSYYVVNKQIASPFTFAINGINDDTGIVEADPQNMRIASTDIIAFTKDVTIDLSGYSAMYNVYCYDLNGNYVKKECPWTSTTTTFEVPANTGIRIKLRHNNYETWDDFSIRLLTSAVKVDMEKDCKYYIVEKSVLGKPLTNVTYRIGTGVDSETFEVYENNARMMVTQSNGVKSYSTSAQLWNEEAYPITVPHNATKLIVTCPGFDWCPMFVNYQDGNYGASYVLGYQNLIGGGELALNAGAYGYMCINFKNSTSSTIPTDTDTSGFSVVFE